MSACFGFCCFDLLPGIWCRFTVLFGSFGVFAVVLFWQCGFLLVSLKFLGLRLMFAFVYVFTWIF